ncbi:hypothetical protein CE91St44_30720 [Oscillospiraceae bacterium]|uniref:phosphopantetheine-binding protein n=1 Tax=Allofournierella sp. TaxID=1940256 RepID=UPI00208778BD|nr:hypothetical protein CE91St44_30720 [Oscillospiraceae bacterium]
MEQLILTLLAEACGSAAAARPGTDLFETGLLDSLAFITLLEGLEDLGITLQPTQIDRACFRTPEGILALARGAAGSRWY